MKKNSISYYYAARNSYPTDHWAVDSYYYKDETVRWCEQERIRLDNEPFWARVEFKSIFRGRSAARIKVQVWRTDQQKSIVYEMFLSHALEVLQTCKVEDGVCWGWWQLVARGANAGLRCMGQEEKP